MFNCIGKRCFVQGSFWVLILLFSLYFQSQSFAQELDLEDLFKMSLEDLMNIEVVTASKRAQKTSEVPAVAHVITAKQIRERGYFTLEEALSDLPGFQFRNILGYNSYVFQRGVPSANNLILILVDGIQINELNSGGFYGGGHYNLSNVERIEVIYGPASALYGTNAISGIINIITRNPEDVKGSYVSGLVGNFSTINTDFGYGYYNKKNELGFNVSGMLKQTDKADLRGEKGDNNWSSNLKNYEDDLSFDMKLGYKKFSMGLVFQDKQTATTTANKGSTNVDSVDTNWHARFINGHLKYVYDKSSKWSSQTQLYYRNATIMDDTHGWPKADGTEWRAYRPNYLIGFENQFNYTPIDKFSIVAGIIAEEEHLAEGFSSIRDVNPPPPPKPKMLTNHLWGIYLQSQYKVISDVELTLGLRHDNSSVYDQVFTPRAGIVYNKDKISAKLLYMQAFRAPKPWDYYWGEGNPDLDPEEMKSFELAFSYKFTKDLNADLSIYRNNVKGKLTKFSTTEIIDSVEVTKAWWVNRGELKSYGAELFLQYVFGNNIYSYFNYTFNMSEDEDGEEIPEIANHSANIGILYAFSKNIKFDVRGNYLGKRLNPKTIPATGSDYVDDAFVLNSTLSFLDILSFINIKNLDCYLIVKNLLDTEYYHTSHREPERYRQPQRTIMLKAAYSF